MHACWKSRNLFKVMLNEKQHVSALSWQPIVTVGIQVPNGTEQPFAENRRRGWWEVSPSYVSESRLGLGLHSAYQGVIYKELVGIDGKKRNRLIYRVVESLEVQFLPLLCLTMCCCGYLRVLRQTLIACQTAGKRGRGRNLGRLAGLSDGSSCGRQSNALFLVQCKPAALLHINVCRRPSVTRAGHSGLHYHCLPLLLPHLPWHCRLLRCWLAADIRDNAHQMLVVWVAQEHR